MYSVDGKVFKNNVYLGDLNIYVNDTASLKEGKSYEYNSRSNVDSVTFGLQMELKKFLMDVALEASNKTKGKKQSRWSY